MRIMRDIKTRKTAVAGSFYPVDREELKKMIEDLVKKAKDVKIPGQLKALVVPHAGYVYSGPVAAAGYRQLMKLDEKTEGKKEWNILLIGTSHYFPMEGISFSDADYWETPLGNVAVEKKKPKSGLCFNIPEVHFQEHCLEVQLPFLQLTLKKFKIIPAIIGEADPEELAELLLLLTDDSTIVIASSDLSHYHPYDEAVRLDSQVNEAVPALDIEKAEKTEACGLNAILTLMHIAKKLGWSGIFLDYKNSGDAADKSQVVGYGCYGFYERNKSD